MIVHLDPEEKIIKEVRKHWFVFLVRLLFLIAVAFLPIIAYWLLNSRLIPFEVNLTDRISTLAYFLYLIWLIGVWVAIFIEWTDYYLDVWYITNKRIVDIDQIGLFHREISSLQYSKIQDITTETKGVIATILNFGDIHVETAGEQRKIIIENSYSPADVKRLILAQCSGEQDGV